MSRADRRPTDRPRAKVTVSELSMISTASLLASNLIAWHRAIEYLERKGVARSVGCAVEGNDQRRRLEVQLRAVIFVLVLLCRSDLWPS